MSTAHDRVLEQALERLLEDPERPAERARAVLRALAGQRALPAEFAQEPERLNGLPHAHRAPQGAARATAGRRRVLYAAVASVAAAAALAVVFFLPWRRAAPPEVAPGPVVARAASPALLLSGAGERRAIDVRVGERVRTDAEGAQLELAGGGRIELAPLSLLAFGAEGPALVLGELSLAGPCDVDLGFARLFAEAGARAEARLELAPGVEGAGVVHPGAWYAAQSQPPPRLLRFALSAGGAVMARGAQREELAPGAVRVWREDEAPARLLSKEEAEMVLARLERIWARPWDTVAGTSFETRVVQLHAFLDGDAARWSIVAEQAREEFVSAKLPLMEKRGWLDLLCLGKSPHGTELARELWLLGPEVFEPWHVVALAQTGAFELEREARARVADPDPDFADCALPAAWLAERGELGEQEALAVLRAIEQRPAESTPEIERAWLAAFALSRAGDSLPLQRRLRRLDAEVREALDQRATGRAAYLVLLAEFYLAEGEEPGDVATVLWRASQHGVERGAEVQSPGEILGALEGLGLGR